jgi:hypothetical protein
MVNQNIIKKMTEVGKKKEPEPMKVALKRLNGSQNISDKYLNEVRLYIKLVYFIFIV